MNEAIQYITEKFKKHDVILLGEHHAVRDTLEFVIDSIPSLYEAGVYHIGMEFGCEEDQAQLDALVTSPTYDEDAARELMFRYNVRWPYVEYMEIYRAAWKLNQTVRDGEPRFRILNLSYEYNWRDFSGVRTPAEAKKIFHRGNTEAFRFQVIEDEILYKQEKILVLTGTPHAFTKYQSAHYAANDDNFIRFEANFLGNRLYEKYGERIFTMLVHQWFQNPKTLAYDVQPANGQIEQLMKKKGSFPQAFDLEGTKMGELRDDSMYAIGYDNFTLANFFDGYLFIKPLEELRRAQIDYKFLESKNFVDVQNNYPDKDWAPVPTTEQEYWHAAEQFGAYK